MQIALAALWQSWGVKPSAVVGHSVGEVAAAHTAGILTLREAARVTFHRGRSMKSAPETGRMLAAGLDSAQAEELAARFPGEVAIAAFSGTAGRSRAHTGSTRRLQPFPTSQLRIPQPSHGRGER